MRRVNAKGKKKRVRNSGEEGEAMDDGCGATREEKRIGKGETDKEEGKERWGTNERTRERKREGHGGSERRVKKANGGVREGHRRRME